MMNFDTSRLSKDFGYCTESVIPFIRFVKIMSFNNGNISNKICSNIAFDYAHVIIFMGPLAFRKQFSLRIFFLMFC